jgi:hypothetical protein
MINIISLSGIAQGQTFDYVAHESINLTKLCDQYISSPLGQNAEEDLEIAKRENNQELNSGKFSQNIIVVPMM